jgi:hypothetical protein
MLSQEQSQEIWENIWREEEHFDKDFSGQVPKLIELLLSKIIHEQEVEIGISSDAGMLSSCITYDFYDKNNRLELFLLENGSFRIDLSLGMFDLKEYSHILNPVQTKLIPEGLKNQMLKALKKEDPITVTANMLEV